MTDRHPIFGELPAPIKGEGNRDPDLYRMVEAALVDDTDYEFDDPDPPDEIQMPFRGESIQDASSMLMAEHMVHPSMLDNPAIEGIVDFATEELGINDAEMFRRWFSATLREAKRARIGNTPEAVLRMLHSAREQQGLVDRKRSYSRYIG